LQAWRGLSLRTRTLVGILLVVGALPLMVRGYKALINIPAASRNIYEQQIQIASFLRTYYQGQSVAANDIGAINYFADIRCMDLWGLGSREVTRLKRSGRYTPGTIEGLCREAEVRIAVVYESWFRGFGGLPPEWEKIGTWTISDNVICGSDTVSFYAVAPEERDLLQARLHLFANRLPQSVRQAGPYTDTGR